MPVMHPPSRVPLSLFCLDRARGMIFGANGGVRDQRRVSPLPFAPLGLPAPFPRPDTPRQGAPRAMQPPVMRASITYHIQPSGCGGGVHQLSHPPADTFALRSQARRSLRARSSTRVSRYFSSGVFTMHTPSNGCYVNRGSKIVF